VFLDPYAGSLEFFESPIQLNYIEDLQNRLSNELKDSYRGLKSSQLLEKSPTAHREAETAKAHRG